MQSLYKKLLDAATKGQWYDKHEIERVRFGLWRCSRPETRMGSFWVAYNGPALVVFGDLGEMILLPYDANALRWAKNTKFDPAYPYYPMTKLSPQMRQREFQPDEATAYLEERVEECKTSHVLDEDDLARWSKMLKDWKDRLLYVGEDRLQDEWYTLWSDHDMDDPPDCTEWSERLIRVYLALCWFMSHVSWDDPRFTEELHEHQKGAVPK